MVKSRIVLILGDSAIPLGRCQLDRQAVPRIEPTFLFFRSDQHGEEQFSNEYGDAEKATAIGLITDDFQMYNDVSLNRI